MHYIDFNYVPDGQRKMDERLHNWARHYKPKATYKVHPMFIWYRPTNSGRETRLPVNVGDAVAIQKAMAHMPATHSLALTWCYIYPGIPANKVAKQLGQSMDGLLRLIVDGRAMLINRRV